MTSVATLSDGRKVASDSEDWLWECLARHVLALPFEQRRPWIEDFADKHKARPEAADTLRRTVTRVHQHQEARDRQRNFAQDDGPVVAPWARR